jgi:LuxR family maltose regulon positive regulatory protein
LEAAAQWAKARGLSIDSLWVGDIRIRSLRDESEHLIWARLLIAQGKADQALQLLARLLDVAQEYGRAGCAIEIRTLQALAEQALGDTEQALATLEGALSLAEPEGYVRTFVDEGAPMARLLRSLSARRSAVSPEYIRQLLDAFPPVSVAKTPPEVETESLRSTAFPLDALTEREMEVLHLLRTELSGPQIAQELYVSVNTVKTHTKRIYDKLGVHSRFEAVARAQELGLM